MLKLLDKKLLPVVVGSTASGKTSLSIELAIHFNGEIVSADSMQIYRGMDIATAKPTTEEKRGVTHHLIDILDTNEHFSVADYTKLANQAISEIFSRGKLPIVAGGTGLYINSLIDNIYFDEIKADPQIRQRLQKEAEKFGNDAMLDRLYSIDVETAKTLHSNNINRIIRAIEVYEQTGITLAEHKRRSRQFESPYEPCIIGLAFKERANLYNRINQRVDEMLECGLLDEARTFYSKELSKTSVQAIGYKELRPYLLGEESLDNCIEELKKQTRRYAKRQITWFRRDERIQWIYVDEFKDNLEVFNTAKKIIANSYNL